jgi:hypothetical protein
MSVYYSVLISIFAVVLALMVIDPNIGYWIDLQVQNAIVQLKRRYYIITIGTVVKFQTWKMKREFKKIREEYGLSDDKDQ